MPFTRPTLTELIDRVVADISNRFGVEGAVLRRSLIGIIGRTEAGAVHLLYGYLDWIAQQVMPDTAESEFLERWGSIWNITRRPAAFASGPFTLVTTAGSIITAGTIIQRQDGVQYSVLAEVTASGASTTVTAQALLPGVAANSLTGLKMTLLSPIAGVQSTVTVAAPGITGGVDVESDNRLRARLLDRIRKPPQGGAEYDYEAWALEVPGVTRVWVSPMELGPGTVTVRFVNDDDPVSIIPGPTLVAAVQANIDAKRPVTAEVFVVAPVAGPLDMTIKLRPNTQPVRDAVTAELDDLFTRTAEPGGTVLISQMREAVSIAAGEDNNQIVTPTADVVSPIGEITTLGTITFQAF